MSLYDDLGISPDATPEEIARAHRAAAKRTHPDQGGDADAFARVSHAALVLRDPERRARYDADGDDGTAPDNTLTRRTEIVVQAFDHAIGNAKAEAPMKDIVLLAQQVLLDDVKGVMEKIGEQKAQIAAFNDAMSRISRNGESDTPMHAVLRSRIRKFEKAIAQNESAIADAQAAVEMLGEYTWRRDPPPPPPPPPSGFGSVYTQATSLQHLMGGRSDIIFPYRQGGQ